AGLAVEQARRADNLAAQRLPDRLMAQAYAQNRDAGLETVDHCQADARLIGRAGAGRQHDGLRRHGGDLLKRDLVVTLDDDIGAQFSEEVDEIVGKTVVIIDDEKAGHIVWSSAVCFQPRSHSRASGNPCFRTSPAIENPPQASSRSGRRMGLRPWPYRPAGSTSSP